MSASKDLEGLVNQIANARNDRRVLMNHLKENFGRIKQDTAGLRQESVAILKSIGRDRQEMSQSLHGQLDKDRADLGVMEKARQKETAMEHNARISLIRELKNELRSNLDNFMSDIKNCTMEDKKQRLTGIKIIKTEVGRLQEDTQTSLKQIRNTQKKMGDELSSMLKTFVSDVKISEKGRKSSVNDFLTSVKAEISAMSSAWGKVMSNVSLNKPAIIQADVEPDKEDDPDEEPEGQELTEELTDGEDETGDSYYDNGPIKEKVMTILSDYSDGLKMTQLAELLDIEQWRTLIPVMRDLMDNKQIRKEGSVYFTL